MINMKIERELKVQVQKCVKACVHISYANTMMLDIKSGVVGTSMSEEF